MLLSMQPVIGINADVRADPEPLVRLKLSYIDAVRRAGGVPVVLPAGAPGETAAMLERVDALILTGGGDIDTRTFGVPLHREAELMDERRQRSDFALARMALDGSLPVLGICLGMQELAVAAGGTLHQHLPDAGYAELLDHRWLHAIRVEPSSRLGAVVESENFDVVSHHHQAVARVPAPFRTVATAPDGVIEAMELPGERFFVCVQWHPERSPDAVQTQALFRALVEAATRNSRRA